MPKKKIILIVWFCLLLAWMVSACSPGSAPEEPTPAPTDVPAPTAAPTDAAPEGLVTDVQEVKSAVVQIQAEGTFLDPEFGRQVNVAGRGSGFIIDPSGIAVTNNHVVTGAALLKVWIGGEDTPRNARVLGVSECSDLAVIDIDGDGYPYLDWRESSVDVGLDIFVAGYPLGDPEYTMTRGIISKASTSGETNWASVDAVLEYDATSNPGNSGGPVVDGDGHVIAVHYASNTSARQAFGISGEIARGIVDRLQGGEDVNAIGVNGTAVVSEDGTLSGIWVASVKSGSPADEAGIRGGDIITSMEGLVLATDGTMSDYCDILRSHSPEDTLSIEVLRYETQEVLEGQLNGRALEQAFSFANRLEDEVEDSPGGSVSTGTYSEYTLVQDDFGAIQMSVPVEWGDVDGSAWAIEGDIIGASIAAAGDLDAFYGTWTEPGVFFGASDDLAELGGYIQLLDRFQFLDSCEYGGREDYQDALYRGSYDIWEDCGGVGTVLIVLSAVPIEDSTAFLILVQVQVVQDADLDALDQILSSFQVVSTLP